MTTLENFYFGNISPSEYKQSKNAKKLTDSKIKRMCAQKYRKVNHVGYFSQFFYNLQIIFVV